MDSLIDHNQQLTGQGVQVDLVLEPDAEGVDRLGRVVAAAVKPSVDGLLDASAQGLEQGGATRAAPATAQLGVRSPTPPNSCPSASTAPA